MSYGRRRGVSKTIIDDLLQFQNEVNLISEETPIFLVFSMYDLFEESLSLFNFKDEYCDKDETGFGESDFEIYNGEISPIEFIRRKFLRIRSKNVIVFETCGFDLNRNEYLYELVGRKCRGEELNEYYPYRKIDKKVTFQFPFKDVNFKFKKFK